jgi:Spy/CpxP family protein refolding chaperone
LSICLERAANSGGFAEQAAEMPVLRGRSLKENPMTARGKRIRLTFGILALVLTPTLLFATQRRALGAGNGPLMQRAMQRLDLTPEQLAQVKDILRAHQQELQAEITAVATARGAMFTAIHADPPSETVIRAAAKAVGAAEANLAVTRSAVVQEVRQVLTPEQQAELKNILADARAFAQDLLERIQQRFAAFVG